MILIIGCDDDPTVNYFIKFLHDMNEKFVFLNQKYIGNGCEIGFENLIIDNKKYEYGEFTGVLNRLASADRDGIKDIKHHNAISHLFGLLSFKFKNVFNRPYAGFSNDSKLFQLSLLDLNHIKIPSNKVISYDKERSCQIDEKMIVKSLSSIRSEVVAFHSNKEKYFTDKSYEPVLFQEKIEGYNVRVHVVLDEAYSVKITSETVDYRYSEEGANFVSYELDRKISQECIKIANSLELRFAGIDLIKQNDSYYILEVNPSPGWSYFECKIGGQDISSKLLKELKKCY